MVCTLIDILSGSVYPYRYPIRWCVPYRYPIRWCVPLYTIRWCVPLQISYQVVCTLISYQVVCTLISYQVVCTLTDILSGGVIGSIIAMLCYFHTYPPPWSPSGHAPHITAGSNSVPSYTVPGNGDGDDCELALSSISGSKHSNRKV